MTAHRRTRPGRRRAALLLGVVLVLAGCSNDGDETGENGNETQVAVTTPESEEGTTKAFCEAAADAIQAAEEGDGLAAADLLQPFVEQLPDDASQDLRAYVDDLQAANPNPDPGDAEGKEQAEVRFRSYVDERCGS